MSIDERKEALSYLVTFLVTFVMSIHDPRGIEALQISQPLKARLEGVVKPVRDFCLRKQGVAAKPMFTRLLAQGFNIA